MASQASTQFDAEQSLLSMAEILNKQGIPRCITYDRDPRFVGGATTDGFPSAFTRFLLCLDCDAEILPAHRPDLKPYVERFSKTVIIECLFNHRPTTSAEANEVLAPYREWFNEERPHQGRDLHNQPPQQILVKGTPRRRLPEKVDPDAWLIYYDKRHYSRHVDSRGIIQLWKCTYYLGQEYANQTASVRLDAVQKVIRVEIGRTLIKTLPLQGLVGHEMEYQEFVGMMSDEARSDWKEYLWKQQLKASEKSKSQIA